MKTIRARILATTLLSSASLFASSAYAQDAQPAEPPATDVSQPADPVEAQAEPSTASTGQRVDEPRDIVVTGSRIPQPNLESAAPVTVVSGQDIKLQGTTKIEDLLNSLPSVSGSQSSGQSISSTGTATVDLRGLGTNRTLVLINSRRVAPGDPFTGSAADINIIPSSIVKRVKCSRAARHRLMARMRLPVS